LKPDLIMTSMRATSILHVGGNNCDSWSDRSRSTSALSETK
jgi:hypothetical protein